jgi:hypothetical protein
VEEEFRVEDDKKRINKEEFRNKRVRKATKERNRRPWTGGRRCGNGRGRILVLSVDTTTSLRMEKFAVSVDIVKKKRPKRGRSRVLFLMRFCRSFCILVAMTMHRALSF